MSVTIKQQEIDRFTPSTHETLDIAQREAIATDAHSVLPEHLLLAIVLQNDERASSMLKRLGMDVETMRAQAETIARKHEHIYDEQCLPLSREADECIGWALSFISRLHVSSIFPDHLLLGVLRHPRVQPLLAFLFPSIESLHMRIAEVIGPAYSMYMDQFIQSRARDQSLVCCTRGIIRRVLRKFECPNEMFTDIEASNSVKRTLREVAAFLKGAPQFQFSGGQFPRGTLFCGSSLNACRLLIRATAGEAVVPLMTISITALVELLADLQSGNLHVEALELPSHEYAIFRRGTLAQKGQHYIHYVFQETKKASPAMLFLEGLDALANLDKHEEREQLVSQIAAEMDGLDKHYRMSITAYTDQPEKVDPTLLKPGRFERQETLEPRVTMQGAQRFCPSCKRNMQPDWQYCVYCGRPGATTCAHCGAPGPTLEGAHFCAACGYPLA